MWGVCVVGGPRILEETREGGRGSGSAHTASVTGGVTVLCLKVHMGP